jgi:uncharacterized protein
MKTYPEYGYFVDSLQQMGGVVTPSEAHGMLCGLILLDSEVELVRWVDEILEEIDFNNVLQKEKLPVLYEMMQATRENLVDDMLGFNLFLPEDDGVSFNLRAAEVKSWIEGFLYGLALAQFDEKNLSVEGNEVLRDYAELTKMDVEEYEAGEEDMRRIEEIIEYIKITVLFLADELVPANSQTVH